MKECVYGWMGGVAAVRLAEDKAWWSASVVPSTNDCSALHRSRVAGQYTHSVSACACMGELSSTTALSQMGASVDGLILAARGPTAVFFAAFPLYLDKGSMRGRRGREGKAPSG